MRSSSTLFTADSLPLKHSIFWTSADAKLVPNDLVNAMYRHQSNIDCLMALFASLVLLMAAAKKVKMSWKMWR